MSVSPEQALVDAEAVARYQAEMALFASNLVELNVNLYIMEQILAFPVDLFLGVPHKTIFLGHVIDNVFAASILLITKLVVDQGSDIHSLRAFAAWLMRAGIKDEHRAWLQAQLRDVHFRRRDDDLLQRLQQLRDRRIAHFLHENAGEDFTQRTAATRVEFAELRSLRDELNDLLQALAFDTEYLLLPLDYEPGKSDIEEFLDLIARDSYILNMPERHPDRWQFTRPRHTPQELTLLNQYRRKFALPDV